jgi:hypothetical protein
VTVSGDPVGREVTRVPTAKPYSALLTSLIRGSAASIRLR